MKVSIIGATGYTGAELLRILSNHPEAEIAYLTSESSTGALISDVYPHLLNVFTQKLCSMEKLDEIVDESDVLFIGLPHGHAMNVCKNLQGKKAKVIDLGADYRFSDIGVYEKWYKVKHVDPSTKAVYGLSELYRDEIKRAKVLANPGCYVTASILALVPLLSAKLIDTKNIVIDAKSGVTGAGRGVALGNHFPELFGNFRPYSVASHRHTPEIEQIYSNVAGEEVVISFTPHLLPIDRGIVATCYASLKDGVSEEDILAAFMAMYKDEFFVRLLGKGVYPAAKQVRGSNYVDIGWQIDERTNKVIVMSALDNLVKGASGQAVQNMNIMFGLSEQLGITQVPLYP